MLEQSETEKLEKALGLALAHVNRRERSVAEVRAQLERKGVSEPIADAVVERLVEDHVLDDARYAELFVTDKRNLEQWGSERIRRGLSEHGVEREIAERALAAADAGTGGGWPGTTDDDGGPRGELGRALELLRRKGYESELALDALAAHTRSR
jgi:regulatory protein